MLSPIDLYLLSDRSTCQVVVTKAVPCTFQSKVREEVVGLYRRSLEQPNNLLFTAAGIGSTPGSSVVNQAIRGDMRCWLTPDLCRTEKLSATAELIKLLVATCKMQLKAEHNLNGEYSVQATLYPGNGAHYARHLDVGTDNTQSTGVRSSNTKGTRRLTFVYYLNDYSEEEKAKSSAVGGQLRLYNVPRPQRVNDGRAAGGDSGAGEGTSVANEEPYFDVEPSLGTLVVFRSDTVEHEVRPCFRDRWALSLWAYTDHAAEGPVPVPVTAPASVLLPSAPPTGASARAPPTASQLTDLLHLLRGAPAAPARTLKPLLPLLGAAEWSASAQEATIFVSIVSYRDSELQHTVRDLLRTAYRKDRVFLGVVNQLSVKDTDCILTASDCAVDVEYFSGHVRTLTLPHTEAQGPTFARSLAAAVYRGEQYVLQVDSHMRFRPHWDAYLIDSLEEVRRREGGRPVLTTYPQGYELPDRVPSCTAPTVLMPSKFDENGFLRQEGKLLERVSEGPGGATTNSSDRDRSGNSRDVCLYFRSPLWAAGFSFSDGCVLAEVPPSPFLPHLFFGEEQSMAARLFTHGYDFFAPSEAVVYHLYSRAHRPTLQQDSGAAAARVQALKQAAVSTVRTLLQMSEPGTGSGAGDTHKESGDAGRLQAVNLSAYGLGAARSLQDFQAMLAEVGVFWPCSPICSSGSSGGSGDGHSGGTVRCDPSARLAFVCRVAGVPAEAAQQFRFAQLGAASVPTADASAPVRKESGGQTEAAIGAGLSQKLDAAALKCLQSFL